MATKAPTKAPAPSIGAITDQIWSLREKKRELESAVKKLEGEIADLEVDLLEKMDAQGIDKVAGALASISISTNTVANVGDWDEFLAFIYKKKYGHLLQRRVSDPAYRELLEQGIKVPGVEPFAKRRLNIRTR